MTASKPHRGVLLIVAAPSGAGKTSLVRALVGSETDVTVSVSHTTRPQRPGEDDGIDYHFVDQASFDDMIANDEFVEHATVFGNAYGTSVSAIEGILDAGKDLVLEIDWQGAQQVRAKFADAVSVFILPPSRETLTERLAKRGQDDEAVIAGRMASAIAEMSHYAEFDYLIVNDDFDRAVEDMLTILRAERLRTARAATRQAKLLESLLA